MIFNKMIVIAFQRNLLSCKDDATLAQMEMDNIGRNMLSVVVLSAGIIY